MPPPKTKPKAKIDPTKPVELGPPLTPPCQVLRVRFTPDGKTLVAAGTDGTIHRWDVSGDKPADLPALTGHDGWVTSLVFAGDMLVSADSWGRLTAHDRAGKSVWTVPAAHDGWLRAVATSPDHATLATCGKDGFIRLWQRSSGKRLGELDAKTDVLAVGFAPDGKSLLAGDLFGLIREFELPAFKVIRTFEAKELHKKDRLQDVGGVRGLLFDPAGKSLLVTGAVPKTGGFVQCTPLLVAFDRTTGKRLWQWKGADEKDGFITDLDGHPDGYLIGTASGQPGQGQLFFLKPGAAQPFFVSPKPNVHSVAVSPDGARIAAALTNANSSGNGKVKGKTGEYPANVSPIQLWNVPKVG